MGTGGSATEKVSKAQVMCLRNSALEYKTGIKLNRGVSYGRAKTRLLRILGVDKMQMKQRLKAYRVLAKKYHRI